ncbi:Flp pilus assembly protein TadD [Paraburkholderia tropica]|nr:Flp pilus assembly protein TadD [Paraburkholderia tropica]
MQTDAHNLLPPMWNLFLDFVDAAARTDPAPAADREAENEAHALLTKARATLLSLDDDALMRIAAQVQEPAKAPAALRFALAAARLAPARVTAQFAAGLALQFANRHADAVEPYRRALAIDPTFPNLRNNLAISLMLIKSERGEVDRLLEDAVAADPGNSRAWINLALLRPTDTDLARPHDAARRALALAPHDPLAINNYAMVCKEAQDWDEAERAARAACEYAPNEASSRFNLAILQLLRGDYAEGWAGHELRWRGSRELASGRPAFAKPQWHGEPLAGRTLLLWGEQGMGDLLQFARYVPMLAERVHREGGKLVWNSFPQMGALLSRSFAGHVDLYCSGGPVEALPPHDCEVSLLSLPFLFDTRDDTLPGPTGYLTADPARAAYWRERLAADAGPRRLKVGLAWTGSLTHQRNPYRRVGLERFAQAFAGMASDVAFYSLQPGAQADVEAARAAGFAIADYSAEWPNFDETAAFVDGLDLVISVCTSAAHLAGALRKRAWVLLDVNPHWVWQLDRRDSPWYPNTTLYRQKQFRDWTPVLDAVSADLAALARESREAASA